MTHRAPRGRAIVEDALLIGVAVLALVTHTSPWLYLLAAAGLCVLAFNVITLHFPREIEIDDRGIKLRAYRREHAYAWEQCSIRVRRFLVKDRVLLRVKDETRRTSRGYWLVAHLTDFPSLVASLESRATRAVNVTIASARQPNVNAPNVDATSAPPHTTA